MTRTATPCSPASPSLISRLFRLAARRTHNGRPAVWIACHDRADALRIAERLRRLGGHTPTGEARRYEFGSPTARDKALREVRAVHGWTSVEALAARRTMPRCG